MQSLKLVVGALILTAWTASAVGADAIPDRKRTRKRIDELIEQFTGGEKQANLGLIKDAVSLSISFGAPTYNEGDKDACYRFYAQTARNLVKAFDRKDGATELGAKAIDLLKKALKSADEQETAELKAWAMRYAFDRTNLIWRIQSAHAQALVSLGDQYFKRSQFTEAITSFQAATDIIQDLALQDSDEMELNLRLAPLALGHALFARKKFAESAQAIQLGLTFVPKWPQYKIDRAGFHGSRDEYDALLEKLKTSAAKKTKDADLQFLLGYELYFGGQKMQALDQFYRAIGIEKNHPGARIFLKYTQDILPLQT